MTQPQSKAVPKARAKQAIARTYFRRFMVISILALLLLGVGWLAFSQQRYKADVIQNRERLLAEKQRIIESRAREAVDFINFMRSRVEGRIRDEIRERVEQAHAQAMSLYTQHLGPRGVVEIKSALRAMRYAGGIGYFFAVSLDGTGQVFPERPELEGADMGGLRDSDGNFFIKNAMDIAKGGGEGFFEYRFLRPGSLGDDHRKISYVKYFAPLDWYIGTGLYVDDMTRALKQEVLQWLASRSYPDGGSIFVGSYEGIPVLGPFKGQKVIDVPDVNGVLIVHELIKAARSGGGIVSYVLPAYDGKPAYPKISYSLGIDEWEWYVGSGIPTDEIEVEMARQHAAYVSSQERISLGILTALILCIIAQTLAMRSASRRMQDDFNLFITFFAKASDEAQPIDRAAIHLAEIDLLAENANNMLVQRNLAQAALRESESRYRGIFDNIIDGYYRADVEGNLLLASPSAMAMTGWEGMEAIQELNIAKDFYADPAKRAVFLEVLQRDGRVDGFVTTLKRRDGTLLDIEVNARMIYDETTNEPRGVEGIFRDISERVRTQELLMQTEKMMSVGGLAAGMAHEINNPLSGILQGIQNIQRRLAPDLPANIKVAKKCGCDLGSLADYLEGRRIPHILDGIRESGERAARIVEGMLSFSQTSETGRAPCDLNDLADRVIRLASSDYDLERKCDFGNIEIQRDYDPAVSSTVCIASEIEQVLLNLLRNAAQAMAEHGTSDGPPRITLRTKANDEHTVVEVEDNGPGMDEATCKRIFDPFFTTKAPGSGTGLGLSLSYFIITQNHGGKFTVESAPGKGSRFCIRLPRTP